jgi:hypothetical protein
MVIRVVMGDFHLNAPTRRDFQSSKQAARPSARMVAAPSRICAARLRTLADGLPADRVFGDGRIAASRAACVALTLAGDIPN